MKFLELQRYEHLVRHYDKQLLNQLNDREYNVLKIPLENKEKGEEIERDEEEIDMNEVEASGRKIDNHQRDPFVNRILKIESAGYERNRFHFEFVDIKQDYQKAKMVFYKEISLALQDGLITEIGII